jgi:hypothetical protein
MPPDVMALRERAGELTGWAIAPAVRAASRARGARMFHPEGRTFAAQVTPLDATLGPRLAGPALVRLSAALWRNGFPHLDVLGLAIRFGWSAPDHGDQDLLFATIPSPLTLALAPFTTRAGNYFANRLWAVAPFDVDGFGRETMTWARRFKMRRRYRAFDATMIYSESRGMIIDYLGTHQHLAVDIHCSVDDDGALCIRSGEQRFYEGPVAFRFPLLFSGVANVREWWDEAASLFRIDVNVSNRIFGPLFGYRGSFSVVESKCATQDIPLDVQPLREEPRE